jgi:hypothetical protein
MLAISVLSDIRPDISKTATRMDYGSELGVEVHGDTSNGVPNDLDAVSEDSYGSAPLTPEPPVECMWEDCSETLPDPASLVIHIDQDHLEGRSEATCLWLGCKQRKVSQASHDVLVEHIRTHTGDKPYFCPVPECGKRFLRNESVLKHCTSVHEYNHTQRVDDSRTKQPSIVGGGNLNKFWRSKPMEFLDEGRPDVEALERQLTWATRLKDKLSAEYDTLRQTKVHAWLEKEKLLDKLLIKELKEEDIQDLLLLAEE